MKASKILFLALLSILSLCVVNTRPVKAAEDSWTTKARMPTARYSFGVAVANGKIYAIGGKNSSDSNIRTNEMYDPATNTWTTKKPMLTARCEFGIAVVQNKIYVIGGLTTGNVFTGENEVYDPETDTWETRQLMPTARGELDANVVNGKIYLIGGMPNSSVNEVYDPATDSWSTKAPVPKAVMDYASAVINNKIYVISGTGPGLINLNQIYNPVTDTWSYGAQIPTAVSHAATGATTGFAAPKRIYVMGGIPYLDPCDLNQVYDPERNTWTTGARMPTVHAGFGIAVVNDVLYAIGGSTGWFQPPSAKNEQYTPIGYVPVPPTISIVSPENKTYTVNNVSLTFTVDKSTSWIGHSLDGQANITISGNTTLTGLSDGTHSLTVYARDLSGNTGSSDTVYFTIDTTLPSITILLPENKTYDTTDIPLNFTVNEPASWIGYSLDSQANVTITENTTLTGLSDEMHSLTVYARDRFANTGASETVYFTIAQKSAPFPTWIVAAIVIIAVVGAALLIYFRKIRKTTEKAEKMAEGVM